MSCSRRPDSSACRSVSSFSSRSIHLNTWPTRGTWRPEACRHQRLHGVVGRELLVCVHCERSCDRFYSSILGALVITPSAFMSLPFVLANRSKSHFCSSVRVQLVR